MFPSSYELSCATRTPEVLSAVCTESSDWLSLSPLTRMLCLSLNAVSSCSLAVRVSFNLLMRPEIWRWIPWWEGNHFYFIFFFSLALWLVSWPFNSHGWPRQNFSLHYLYNINQISDENKEKDQFDDNYLIQYLIFWTNITTIVWLTVRRTTKLIWELKGQMASLSFTAL